MRTIKCNVMRNCHAKNVCRCWHCIFHWNMDIHVSLKRTMPTPTYIFSMTITHNITATRKMENSLQIHSPLDLFIGSVSIRHNRLSTVDRRLRMSVILFPKTWNSRKLHSFKKLILKIVWNSTLFVDFKPCSHEYNWHCQLFTSNNLTYSYTNDTQGFMNLQPTIEVISKWLSVHKTKASISHQQTGLMSTVKTTNRLIILNASGKI